MQIAKLTTSMEIQSDISIEYAAFSNALSLIPHMLHEIEESLLAVTNQAIYPSLLPAESILRTIPFYSKQSILSATVSAVISSKMNTIEISVPEFINPFTVCIKQRLFLALHFIHVYFSALFPLYYIL